MVFWADSHSMRPLLKLARVTLLYNICFLVTVILRYYDFISDRDIKSTIIVSGYILSLIANLALHAWIMLVVLTKNAFPALQPKGLFLANTICFVIQLIFLVT